MNIRPRQPSERTDLITAISKVISSLSDDRLRDIYTEINRTCENRMEKQLREIGWSPSGSGEGLWISPSGEEYELQEAWDFNFKYGGCIGQLVNADWTACQGPYQTKDSELHYKKGSRSWYVAGPGNALICEGCDEYTAKRIASDHNARKN